MLSPEQRRSDMVNPDQICVRQDDSVASPDIFGIQVRDGDVLDDDVGYTGHAQTFAVQSGAVDADEGLVGFHGDALVARCVDCGGVKGLGAGAAGQGVEHSLAAVGWCAC